MASPPNSGSNKSDSTRVDLGDDLLEGTRIGSAASSTAAPEMDLRARVEDQLQSARILMAEGLHLEARRALHQVLVNEPRNPFALAMLEDLHAEELRKLIPSAEELLASARLGEERSRIREDSSRIREIPEDPEKIIARLDADLGVGLATGMTANGSLWSGEAAQRELARVIVGQASDLTARERCDLATGFLQMEIPLVTVELLRGHTEQDPAIRAVYCWGLLLCSRPYDCIAELETVLQEGGSAGDVLREYQYLTARAREALGQREDAIRAYSVLEDYRDSVRRIQNLKAQGRRR